MQVVVKLETLEAVIRMCAIVNEFVDITANHDDFFVGSELTVSSTTTDITDLQKWVDGESAPPGYAWSGEDRTVLVTQQDAQKEETVKSSTNLDTRLAELLSIFDGTVPSIHTLFLLVDELDRFEVDVTQSVPLHEVIANKLSTDLYTAHVFIEQCFDKFITQLKSLLTQLNAGKSLDEAFASLDLTPAPVPTTVNSLAYFRDKYTRLVNRAVDDFWARKFTNSVGVWMWAQTLYEDAKEFINNGYPQSEIPQSVQTYATITNQTVNAAADAIVAQRTTLVSVAIVIEPERAKVLDTIATAQDVPSMRVAYQNFVTFLQGVQ